MKMLACRVDDNAICDWIARLKQRSIRIDSPILRYGTDGVDYATMRNSRPQRGSEREFNRDRSDRDRPYTKRQSEATQSNSSARNAQPARKDDFEDKKKLRELDEMRFLQEQEARKTADLKAASSAEPASEEEMMRRMGFASSFTSTKGQMHDQATRLEAANVVVNRKFKQVVVKQKK